MQYGSVGKTFYFNFTVNGLDGSGKQLTSISWALRKCGEPRQDPPIATGQSALHYLDHSDYNAGCCEIAIDSTDLESKSVYALYAWTEIATGIVPSFFVGQFELTTSGAIPGTVTVSPAGQTTGYGVTYDKGGVVVGNVGVTCQLIKVNPLVTGVVFNSEIRTETSDDNGNIEFTGLFPGATYLFKRRSGTDVEIDGYEITIPLTWTADTYVLPPIIGTP